MHDGLCLGDDNSFSDDNSTDNVPNGINFDDGGCLVFIIGGGR